MRDVEVFVQFALQTKQFLILSLKLLTRDFNLLTIHLSRCIIRGVGLLVNQISQLVFEQVNLPLKRVNLLNSVISLLLTLEDLRCYTFNELLKKPVNLLLKITVRNKSAFGTCLIDNTRICACAF